MLGFNYHDILSYHAIQSRGSGAIPGAIAGGGIWAGEKAYDGYMNWQTQMGIFLNNFENGLKNGWVPGR